MKKTFITLLAIVSAFVAQAQNELKNQPMQPLPHQVEDLELIDLFGKPTSTLPMWGEKNLLIFYVDPDVPKQNHDFISHIEETRRVYGPNIEGFGIVNLKDSWYPVPNSVIRQIAEARRSNKRKALLQKVAFAVLNQSTPLCV